MTSKTMTLLALMISAPLLSACMGSDQVNTETEIEATLDTDLDGDGRAAGENTD